MISYFNLSKTKLQKTKLQFCVQDVQMEIN